MEDFYDELNKAIEIAKANAKYLPANVLLDTESYEFATDEFGRWVFVTEKESGTRVIIFVPMVGDHVVRYIELLPEENAFSISGWEGEVVYTFDAVFKEIGMYNDIILVSSEGDLIE
jgi:hypothetical protein